MYIFNVFILVLPLWGSI